MFLISLPFSLYSYYTASSFGLTKITASKWMLRNTASQMITIAWVTAVLCSMLFILNRIRSYILVIPVMLIALGLAGTVLDQYALTPLFYKSAPLPDSQLKARIQSLCEQSGIRVPKIELINRSSYATDANAYFTGFGSERRVVLYDTLLGNFSQDEIMYIVAHELYHYKKEHVLIGILCMGMSVFLLLLLCKIILQKKGIPENTLITAKNIPLMIVMCMAILFISSPVQNKNFAYNGDTCRFVCTSDGQCRHVSGINVCAPCAGKPF